MYGDKEHSGIAIMMFLPADVAGRLALLGGEKPEDLHLAVAFLGDRADLSEEQQARLQATVKDFAAFQKPLKGTISGAGRFNESEGSDGKAVIYASFDSPDLVAFRQDLISRLEMNGIGVATGHGYTPHITLAYVEPDNYSEVQVGTQDIILDSITLGMGDDRQTFQLGQSAKETTMAFQGGCRWCGYGIQESIKALEKCPYCWN